MLTIPAPKISDITYPKNTNSNLLELYLSHEDNIIGYLIDKGCDPDKRDNIDYVEVSDYNIKYYWFIDNNNLPQNGKIRVCCVDIDGNIGPWT